MAHFVPMSTMCVEYRTNRCGAGCNAPSPPAITARRAPPEWHHHNAAGFGYPMWAEPIRWPTCSKTTVNTEQTREVYQTSILRQPQRLVPGLSAFSKFLLLRQFSDCSIIVFMMVRPSASMRSAFFFRLIKIQRWRKYSFIFRVCIIFMVWKRFSIANIIILNMI